MHGTTEPDQSRNDDVNQTRATKPDSPVKMDTDTNVEPSKAYHRLTEAGFMPFDMDPATYGTAQTGLESISRVPTLRIGQDELETAESDEPTRHGKDRVTLVDPQRVPCPRLCGAVFAPGISGLVSFRNGEVKKMWSWYEKGAGRLPKDGTTTTKTDSEPSRSVDGQSYPRSFQDLLTMTNTVKDTQWGQTGRIDNSQHELGMDDNIGGDVNDSLDDDDDTDDDDDEYDDDDDDEDEDENVDVDVDVDVDEMAVAGGQTSQDDLYSVYFPGDMGRRTLAQPPGVSLREPHQTKDERKETTAGSLEDSSHVQNEDVMRKAFANATTDMISPVVQVWKQVSTSRNLFNRQTRELAVSLAFGDVPDVILGESHPVDQHDLPPPDLTLLGTSTVSARKGTAVPEIPYSIVTSSEKAVTRTHVASISHVNSDPSLRPRFLVEDGKDEPSVHGGGAGLKFQRQNSMVFLRNLFSQQQQSTGAAYQAPPDAPLCEFNPYSFTFDADAYQAMMCICVYSYRDIPTGARPARIVRLILV